MPTTKKRVNITPSQEVMTALEILAKGDKVPVATKANQLLEMALELLEDQILSELAEEREKSSNGKYLTHEEVWNGL